MTYESLVTRYRGNKQNNSKGKRENTSTMV